MGRGAGLQGTLAAQVVEISTNEDQVLTDRNPQRYRLDSRAGREWSMCDDCRAVLAVLPSNSGHIHPDENFQSIEVA